MFDLLFSLVLAGGFALFLSAAWFVFTALLYIVYRLDGGKMGFMSYLNKM